MATFPLYDGWTELNGMLRSNPNSLGTKRDTPAATAASITVFCLGTAGGARAQMTVSHPISDQTLPGHEQMSYLLKLS